MDYADSHGRLWGSYEPTSSLTPGTLKLPAVEAGLVNAHKIHHV